MELLMFRQSGMPIELTDIDQYEREWKIFFDKASERAKLDMFKLNRMLRYGEFKLKKQFKLEKKIKLPTSKKAMNELLSSVEDTPIMIAKSADRTQLVAVIMDQLQA